jgi:hypothetical protein
MWIVLVEFIRERKGDNWQTGIIIRAGLSLVVLLFALFELEIAFFAVNIRDAAIPTL